MKIEIFAEISEDPIFSQNVDEVAQMLQSRGAKRVYIGFMSKNDNRAHIKCEVENMDAALKEFQTIPKLKIINSYEEYNESKFK